MFMFVISELVESSIITIFICLADDPMTLLNTKPDEYHKFMSHLNVYYPNREGPQPDL
jgi:hypothetical protein